MKKIIALLLAIMSSLLFISCAADSDGENSGTTFEPEEEYGYASILSDRHFVNGFNMRGLGLPIYGDPIESFGDMYYPNVFFQYEKEGLPEPSWYLFQTATRYPFHDTRNESPHLSQGMKNYDSTWYRKECTITKILPKR